MSNRADILLRCKIYLAGPMRHFPYYNFPLFDMIASTLRMAGHEVANPADMDREQRGFDAAKLPADSDWSLVPDGFDLHGCIRHDVEAVLWADALVLLPMWEQSIGATAEVAIARWAMKDVRVWGGFADYLPRLENL